MSTEQVCRYKFLVIDDEDLLDVRDLSRKVNQAIKHPQPVLRLDAPWDRDDERFSYANIMYDAEENIFKMWYWVWRAQYQQAAVIVEGGNKLAYATSKDGIHWDRPELGLLDINGSKKNNYIIPELGIYGANAIDDRSDIPARRYKMIFGSLGREASWAGFHVPLSLAYSADGINWKRPEHVNPVLRGISDGEFTLFYDRDRRKYQLYTRRTPNLPRDISLYESYDLVNWEDLGRVVVPGDELDPPEMYNFYNMAPFCYENFFLGMLNPQHAHPISEAYESYHKSPEYPRDMLGHVDIQLAYSRDTRRWSRPRDRSPVVPNGKLGERDFGGIYPSKSPVVVNGDTFIYYTASRYLHSWWEEFEKKEKERDICCLMLAKMPEDHWVSLDAGPEGGSLITKPWGPPHEVFVNADAAGGSIEAELVTPYGEPVPDYTRGDCIPVKANGKGQQIKWKCAKHPWALREQYRGGVLVKFHVKNAKLYSYTLTLPDPTGDLEQDKLNARWLDHIKHRSDNWGRNNNEPATGLPPYTGRKMKSPAL